MHSTLLGPFFGGGERDTTKQGRVAQSRSSTTCCSQHGHSAPMDAPGSAMLRLHPRPALLQQFVACLTRDHMQLASNTACGSTTCAPLLCQRRQKKQTGPPTRRSKAYHGCRRPLQHTAAGRTRQAQRSRQTQNQDTGSRYFVVRAVPPVGAHDDNGGGPQQHQCDRQPCRTHCAGVLPQQCSTLASAACVEHCRHKLSCQLAGSSSDNTFQEPQPTRLSFQALAQHSQHWLSVSPPRGEPSLPPQNKNTNR